MRKAIRQIGGKNQSVSKLLELIPYHNKYVEVFGGGASLLFAKIPSFREVYNDKDELLYNYFVVLRDHHQAFFKYIKNTPVSRELFEKYKCSSIEKANKEIYKLGDVEKAAIFYYMKCITYMGKMEAFDINSSQYSMYQRNDVRQILRWRNRLRNVIIENLDYKEILERYDGNDVLFYLDPPYYEKDNTWYVENFDEHDKLRDLLSNIKGKFLLSYRENIRIRELYKNFKIINIETRDMIQNRLDVSKDQIDLAITNY